jgi:hypothetical protein
MHTTPQKWLFQTPSEILVHRGVCTLNGMAPTQQVENFEHYERHTERKYVKHTKR